MTITSFDEMYLAAFPFSFGLMCGAFHVLFFSFYLHVSLVTPFALPLPQRSSDHMADAYGLGYITLNLRHAQDVPYIIFVNPERLDVKAHNLSDVACFLKERVPSGVAHLIKRDAHRLKVGCPAHDHNDREGCLLREFPDVYHIESCEGDTVEHDASDDCGETRSGDHFNESVCGIHAVDGDFSVQEALYPRAPGDCPDDRYCCVGETVEGSVINPYYPALSLE